MAYEFKPEDQLVKSHVLLLNYGDITMGDVPDLFNLREAVQKAWDKYLKENGGK